MNNMLQYTMLTGEALITWCQEQARHNPNLWGTETWGNAHTGKFSTQAISAWMLSQGWCPTTPGGEVLTYKAGLTNIRRGSTRADFLSKLPGGTTAFLLHTDVPYGHAACIIRAPNQEEWLLMDSVEPTHQPRQTHDCIEGRHLRKGSRPVR